MHLFIYSHEYHHHCESFKDILPQWSSWDYKRKKSKFYMTLYFTKNWSSTCRIYKCAHVCLYSRCSGKILWISLNIMYEIETEFSVYMKTCILLSSECIERWRRAKGKDWGPACNIKRTNRASQRSIRLRILRRHSSLIWLPLLF